MKTKDQTLLENIYDEMKYDVPEKETSDLTQRISDVLIDSDDWNDLAKAISEIVKEHYGSHLIKPFKQKLNEYLPDPVNEK